MGKTWVNLPEQISTWYYSSVDKWVKLTSNEQIREFLLDNEQAREFMPLALLLCAQSCGNQSNNKVHTKN